MARDHLDTLFHVLSDPTRRRVVERLAAGPASVSELAVPFDMALPTLLRHLKVLEAIGLIRTEKKGRVRTCHIASDPLELAEKWFRSQRCIWEDRIDGLGPLVGAMEARRNGRARPPGVPLPGELGGMFD